MSSPTDEQQNDKKQFLLWINENYSHLSKEVCDQLLLFGDLLREASERKGLIAKRDRPQVLCRHVGEALAPAHLKRLPEGARILDVGTGGGLPGIPLAIVRNDVTVSLVEPRQRKVQFLERAVLVTGISARVSVHAWTLEESTRNHPETRYTLALSRGFHWTRQDLSSLDEALTPEGFLIRFGSPALTHPGVEVVPIGVDRAIQVWPRPSWDHLPDSA